MKRALFLTKKTATLLTEIVANANAITTMQTEITDNMNNFATFLQNLKDKYGEVNASTDTTQDISNQMIGQ
jgi:methyl-accepting chemotaxis protein